MAELLKFKMCPPGIVLDLLGDYLDDFQPELCVMLLNGCGRYLLYTPETRVRTSNQVERMMKLKNNRSLPLRTEISIEDCYYQLIPPEKKETKKAKSKLETLVRFIVYNYIYNEPDMDKVVDLVLLLPWDGKVNHDNFEAPDGVDENGNLIEDANDPESGAEGKTDPAASAASGSGAEGTASGTASGTAPTGGALAEKKKKEKEDLSKPVESKVGMLIKRGILDLQLHVDYEHLYCIASLLSGLMSFRSDFVYECVDTLLERIQVRRGCKLCN